MSHSSTFAVLTPRSKGGYRVITTCRSERQALRLSRVLARNLKTKSRVYTEAKPGQVYCTELKRWVSIEVALVSDGQLSNILTTLVSAPANAGLTRLQEAL